MSHDKDLVYLSIYFFLSGQCDQTKGSMKLQERRALITGSGRGIGEQIALRLAQEGARVALLARDRQQLRSTGEKIEKIGAEHLIVPADLSSEGQIREAVGGVVDRWGGIDVLVNNAGMLGPVGPTQDLEYSAWMETLQVNLGGCYLCCAFTLPGMIERRKGKIINLSGGGAVNPRPNFGAYSASKAAVVRFTETLAAEVAEYGIDVNAISPGAINTAMLREAVDAGSMAGNEADELREIAQKGGQDPSRAASLVVHLASSATDGLSGRLISAQWDDWENFDIQGVMAGNLYTMTRITCDSK
tara:strand:+ start:4713 stop:5618 length:906 start_codon:yes stop_codon:yes gene_type:complete